MAERIAEIETISTDMGWTDDQISKIKFYAQIYHGFERARESPKGSRDYAENLLNEARMVKRYIPKEVRKRLKISNRLLENIDQYCQKRAEKMALLEEALFGKDCISWDVVDDIIETSRKESKK